MSKANTRPANAGANPIDIVWSDLDDLFNDASDDATPLPDLFDQMVTRQAEEHGGDSLSAPQTEAQQLLDLWGEDLARDCLSDWRAAVARYAPGVHVVDSQTSGLSEPALAGGDDSKFNDAEMLGTETPEMLELLDRQFVFMTGELYGQGNRNNTQDGDWDRKSLTLGHWLAGEAKSGKKAAWGFTRHPVAKSKEGAAIVLADALDGARTDSAITVYHAMGLDIDSGAKLDDVLARLQELGLFAIVYTSFNHGKSELVLKHDDVMRKLKLTESPNRTQVQIYLREYHKDRYDESFIQSVEIVEGRKQTKDGLRIILRTEPLDKFRVILPLATPVELANLGASVAQWKDVWADAVCGVAVNMLGVSFDASSCDVNRLFYTPRHKAGAEYYSAVVQGSPLRFEDIQPHSKTAYQKNRGTSDPFAEGLHSGGIDDRQEYLTPDGMSLNRWHKKYKERWQAADVIESFCPDKIVAGASDKPGTVTIECPFEHLHSTSGGTATLVMNPDANEHGFWSIFCRHDACAGRDKLEFVAEMRAQGWFDESLLTDEEWCIPLPDQDMEADAEWTTGEALTLAQEAERFDHDTPESDIRRLIKKALRRNVDRTEAERLKLALADSTVLGKAGVKALWKDVAKEWAHKKDESDDDFKQRPPVVGGDGVADFKDQVAYGLKRIEQANDECPRLFNYLDGTPSRIERTPEGHPRIRTLDLLRFGAELNEVTTWHRVTTKNDSVWRTEVAAPSGVVAQLYGSTAMNLPRLRGIASTPFFAAGGRLVEAEGYDVQSGIYLSLAHGLDVPRVSKIPTDDEVKEAKRLIIEEVFADFPLGGGSRDEIVAAMLDPEGEGNPAGAHALACLLLMFCRDLIKGPTPGHLFTKPQPGTGASLLIDVENVIGYGEPTAAQALPTTREEMAKTLLTVIADGSNVMYFDNIDKDVNSGELASFMTTPRYKGRGLGGNQSIEAEVRVIAMFAGNNVRLSPELVRRLVMIDLNANSAQPEKRKGNGEGPDAKWRHPDIMAYVRENRGRLVWACLTLIQNWIAKGMKECDSAILNSYEVWSRVMGGILRDAGIKGFLGNRDALEETATDDNDHNIHMLVAELASYPDGTAFKIGKPIGDIPAVMSIANGENDINDGLPIRIKQTDYSRTASDPNPDGDGDGDNRLYKSSASFGKWFAREVVAMVNDKPRVWRVELWDAATQKRVPYDVRFYLGKDTATGVAQYRMEKAAV